ncbi:unnamed protein product [Durusdinium trenchii]|uniref:Uncharacterized protein n=1 Tax=Durusdinium trenchii TaxID=1381693 RepID=A0ABP0L3T3_9DINO
MIEYSETWLILTLLRWKGSVFPRSCYFAIPSALLTGLLLQVEESAQVRLREELGLLDANRSQLWIISVGVLHALLIFRINRAMERFWEGTGLLHQMRGEWFDAVSCCVTFTRGSIATRFEETMKFRHTIVRLMSLCHGSALEEIGGEESDFCETIDAAGLSNLTQAHLKECAEVLRFNRVEVLLHMIQSLITHNLDIGILKVQPPILSRVYQTLSRGFVNLLNAKKIADTRFPFPFSQLISALLFVHVVMLPVLLSAVISEVWLAMTLTFIPIFSMCCLNYIGVELENPFGRDDNDLPLKHFQAEMNNCLLMLLHRSADFMAGVSKQRCIVDIQDIREAMRITSMESWLQDAIAKAATSSTDIPAKDNEDSLTDSALSDMEVALEDGEPPPGRRPEKLLPPARSETSSGEAFEEKLQPTTLLQGMDQVVSVLMGIRQAIEVQSEDVGRSIDSFLSLAETLRKSGELGDDLILDEDESHDVSFAHGWDCHVLFASGS